MLSRLLQKTLKKANLTISRAKTYPDFYYRPYSSRSTLEKRFINIGSGGFYHPFWTNLDYSTSWYKKRQTKEFTNIDLTQETDWPFENSSFELAYCEHTIEHLPTRSVEKTFQEVYRTLRAGGIFRIACPDADLFYETLRLRNGQNYWFWRDNWFSKNAPNYQPQLGDFITREVATKKCPAAQPANVDKLYHDDVIKLFYSQSKSDFFNGLVKGLSFDDNYPGYHINWWTFEKIEGLLRSSGFSEVIISSKNKSLAPPFQDHNNFDLTHPQMSLYLEALK